MLSGEAGLIFQIQNRQSRRFRIRAAPVEEYAQDPHAAVSLAIDTGCEFLELEDLEGAADMQLIFEIISRASFPIREDFVGAGEPQESAGICRVRVVSVVAVREQPEDALNGFKFGGGADLQKLVIIDELRILQSNLPRATHPTSLRPGGAFQVKLRGIWYPSR
jgi:hypothetical protein